MNRTDTTRMRAVGLRLTSMSGTLTRESSTIAPSSITSPEKSSGIMMNGCWIWSRSELVRETRTPLATSA